MHSVKSVKTKQPPLFYLVLVVDPKQHRQKVRYEEYARTSKSITPITSQTLVTPTRMQPQLSSPRRSRTLLRANFPTYGGIGDGAYLYSRLVSSGMCGGRKTWIRGRSPASPSFPPPPAVPIIVRPYYALLGAAVP